MNQTELERLLSEKIPLARAMGVQVSEYTGDILTLTAPLDANHNHLGTAFGGSLHALATLACYGWLWLRLGDASAHIVIRQSSIEYLRPVNGILRATCRTPEPAVVDRFVEAWRTGRRTRISLRAIVGEETEPDVVFLGQFVALT